MTRQPVHFRSVLRLEQLERRDAPATLIGNNKVTYMDTDGDNVTVTFSKPILNAGNVNTVFTFDTGSVDGSNATKQQLRRIDLTGIGAPATGTTVATVATRSLVTGGDGFAALGHINATGIDLGAVAIDGDLGRIRAGDATTTTNGLKGLTVHSLGRFGTSTGAPDLNTVIEGKLDFLKVKADVKEAFIDVQGGADGKLGSVNIGGSLIGGGGFGSGRIISTGAMGAVRIAGNVQGAGGDQSGQIITFSTLAGVTLGGSLLGGTIDFTGDFSGQISSGGAMGVVRIAGNIQGGGGTDSGAIGTNSTLAGEIIGGSLLGGAGTGSGHLFSTGAMGAVKIAGSVQGAGGDRSGLIITSGALAGVTIGGSLVGAVGDRSGHISSAGAIGAVKIAGDLVGGSASGTPSLSESGFIHGQRIASLTLGGSLIAGVDNTTGSFRNNGAIRAAADIGVLLIKGSIIGNATNPAIISARGRATPTATTDLAIGSLRVLGRVEFAQILAGVDVAGAAKNADAQIGPVFVGGDWIASSLVAGAVSTNAFFGDADDAKMAGGGVKDEATLSSKIASLTIAGQALGTFSGGDHFGIVAETVGAVKIGGTPLVLTLGNGNDDLLAGITGDFRVNEI